jgi:hypothetical protein
MLRSLLEKPHRRGVDRDHLSKRTVEELAIVSVNVGPFCRSERTLDYAQGDQASSKPDVEVCFKGPLALLFVEDVGSKAPDSLRPKHGEQNIADDHMVCVQLRKFSGG